MRLQWAALVFVWSAAHADEPDSPSSPEQTTSIALFSSKAPVSAIKAAACSLRPVATIAGRSRAFDVRFGDERRSMYAHLSPTCWPGCRSCGSALDCLDVFLELAVNGGVARELAIEIFEAFLRLRAVLIDLGFELLPCMGERAYRHHLASDLGEIAAGCHVAPQLVDLSIDLRIELRDRVHYVLQRRLRHSR